MNIFEKTMADLQDCFDTIVAEKTEYVTNPEKDFTRNRKLPMDMMLNIIYGMEGGTLNKVLRTKFKYDKSTPAAASFVEARHKIKSEAYEDIFHMFSEKKEFTKTYKGYRLLAADGTDINLPRNEKSPFYVPPKNGVGDYNQCHLNTIYDILENEYIAYHMQPRNQFDERRALIEMLSEMDFDEPTILIADRGYQSFNMIEHINRKPNLYFVIRARDRNLTELKEMPMCEWDEDMSFLLTTSNSKTKDTENLFKEYATAYHDHPYYHFLAGNGAYGKYVHRSDWDFETPWVWNVRAVRIQLPGGHYETIFTNLPREEFHSVEIDYLYHQRWNIETSYRNLKYVVGMCLHARNEEFALQEIITRLTMFNFVSRVVAGVVIEQPLYTKWEYHASYTDVASICLAIFNGNAPPGGVELMSRYIQPVRPWRMEPRRPVRVKTFFSFSYRVAA